MNTRLLSPYEQTQLAKHGIGSATSIPASKPIEYVTNHAEFCGMDFFVDQSVLIPRIETEGLVELTLQAITERAASDTAITVVEVGVGSGAVIISVLQHVRQSKWPVQLIGLDVSSEAVMIAQQNESRLVHENWIEWKQSDLLAAIPSNQIDILVANLPYIPSARIETLDASVKEFEPLLALDGGHDGFQLIRQLLDQAQKTLTPTGTILLEVDSQHTPEWFDPWKNNFKITPFTDCYDRHRFIRLDLLPRDK
jgi:release factor glutamine methyltransferase